MTHFVASWLEETRWLGTVGWYLGYFQEKKRGGMTVIGRGGTQTAGTRVTVSRKRYTGWSITE